MQIFFHLLSVVLIVYICAKLFSLPESEIKLYLQQSLLNQNKIMATQSELAAQLTALTAQVDKVKTEVVEKIAALEEAIANAGGTTPEVDAALEALKSAVQTVDDINPDKEV